MEKPGLELNLNKLRAFESVARLRSFTAAGAELNISQPAVTVQVRDLERHFGVPLIDRRRRRRVELTRDGELLSEYARRILATALEAERALIGARELDVGTLPLVATPTAASYCLPAVLDAFKSRYPGIHVELLVVNSREALKRVAALQSDLGVLTGPVRDPTLVTVPFFEDRLVLAVARDHPLARRRSVDVRRLAGERMIIREKGSATRALVEAELRRAGVKVEASMELASNEATLQTVSSGHGLAIVSAEVVQRDVEAGRIAAVALRGVDLKRTFWFVCRRERAHYPTVREFIATGQRVMRRSRR
ncbi:MAG TPA: LysR family transcriptional regulator [Methylomirabilota bacterium]|nr:LysR family transcriptional regulator [Methylomirabilota bacterium]